MSLTTRITEELEADVPAPEAVPAAPAQISTVELKRRLSHAFRIPSAKLRVRGVTTQRANGYIQAWITPERGPNHLAPLSYQFEFPTNFRRLVIGMLKGDPNNEQTNYGNVQAYSISLLVSEWEAALKHI
jgi:hypothetical protein